MKNTPKKKKVIDIYPPDSLKKKNESASAEQGYVEYQEKEENILIRIESAPLSRAQAESPAIEEQLTLNGEKDEAITDEPQAYEAPFVFSRPGLRTPKIKPLKAVLFLGLFGLFYYLGFVVLPMAEVSITSQKLTLSLATTQVLIDKNIAETNYSQKVIPGNLFIFTENNEQEFKSTGQGKDEQRAKGIITVVNNFSTAPQILVASTRFRTPDGKIFRLDSRIVVPGATMKNGKLEPASIDANVTADNPGPEYNIAVCNNDCKFTIPGFEGTPKFDGFYGINDKPMIGGASGSMPMITADDLKKAENAVLDAIASKINENLKSTIPNDLKILDGARSGIKIEKLNSDGEIGNFRQNFTVTATGETRVIVFREQDLNEFVQSQFNSQKPEKYDYCGSPVITYEDLQADFAKGTLKLTISAEQIICYHLSPDEIKEKIADKNQKELEMALKSLDGIEETKAKLFPFWVKKVPANLNKIKIIID